LTPAALALALAGELLLVPEGNRLRRVDLGSLAQGDTRAEVLLERAARDPGRGRDLNGMVCPLPDGSGRFVAGEDTGQPHPPAGWAVLEADGTQVGKLAATARAVVPDPYGCAFDAQGRLFTTEIGDVGFGGGTGQLVLWFPPFDRFPGPPGAYPDTDAASGDACKLATDLATATGLAIDRAGRVYVAETSGFGIARFSPPFPTGPDAEGGCGGRDATGAPLADHVQRERFVWARPLDGLLTYSGLALAPNGNLYAASVVTGRIGEFDLEGNLVRLVLDPERWLPPYPTGTPQGLAVDAAGSLYYADLDLVRRGVSLAPGPDGKVWRIRFEGGAPQPPELVLRGLEYPDGLGVLAPRLVP
jgi:hypothetical protein